MTRRGLPLLLCSLLLQTNARARDYYVSPMGSDSNPGTRSAPWQSLAAVNRTAFRPGDHIHFEGAQRFTGTIELDRADGGTSDRKLIVTSYGEGRAVIDGGNGSGLHGLSKEILSARGHARQRPLHWGLVKAVASTAWR